MAVPHFTPRHTMRRSDSRRAAKGSSMIGFLLWLLLLVLCWPLALLALLLYPLVWLLSLPFRLVGITVEGVFALLRALILLPARYWAADGAERPKSSVRERLQIRAQRRAPAVELLEPLGGIAQCCEILD